MTTLVSTDRFYVAKSTDVTEGVLDNASIIGAKVYITDSKEWYIIDEAGVLQPYLSPQNQVIPT